MWTMNENLVPHLYDNVRTDTLREAERLGMLRREPLFRSIHPGRAARAAAVRLGGFLIEVGKRLERLDPAAGAA